MVWGSIYGNSVGKIENIDGKNVYHNIPSGLNLICSGFLYHIINNSIDTLKLCRGYLIRTMESRVDGIWDLGFIRLVKSKASLWEQQETFGSQLKKETIVKYMAIKPAGKPTEAK